MAKELLGLMNPHDYVGLYCQMAIVRYQAGGRKPTEENIRAELAECDKQCDTDFCNDEFVYAVMEQLGMLPADADAADADSAEADTAEAEAEADEQAAPPAAAQSPDEE